MHVVRLLPETARLKQLIKEFGDVWFLNGLPEPMQCFDNDHGQRIVSLDGNHERNVRCEHLTACNKAKAIV